MLQITPEELPTAIIISGVNKRTETPNKYMYPKDEYGHLNKENLIKFITNFQNNNLTKHFLSEPLPDEAINMFNVHKIVTNNLDEFIYKSSVNHTIFILFCHYSIPECSEIGDRFQNISLKLKNEKNLMFANIDPFLNEIEQVRVQNMPGILALQNKNKILINQKEFDLFSFQSSEMLSNMKNYTQIDYIAKYYNEEEKDELAHEPPVKSEDEEDQGNNKGQDHDHDHDHDHEQDHDHDHDQDHDQAHSGEDYDDKDHEEEQDVHKKDDL